MIITFVGFVPISLSLLIYLFRVVTATAEHQATAFVLKGISVNSKYKPSSLSWLPCFHLGNDANIARHVFIRKNHVWPLSSTFGSSEDNEPFDETDWDIGNVWPDETDELEEDDYKDSFGDDASTTWSKNGSNESNDWSQYSSDDGVSDQNENTESSGDTSDEEDQSDNWLDALAEIAREEVNFMNTEAERADRAREMQELGFTPEQIGGTLDVATTAELENEEAGEEFVEFQKATSGTEGGFGMMTYDEDEVDKREIESHLTVERDEDGDLTRSKMIYVDEIECIGCTLCTNYAQSTFFMDDEYGRARVFDQWGDDDETIEIAIETCPVDCIHFVSYEELVRLETERRGLTINYKARLVGGNQGSRVGAVVPYSENQVINGSNALGGVGGDAEYLREEEERKQKIKKKQLSQQLEQLDRSADL